MSDIKICGSGSCNGVCISAEYLLVAPTLHASGNVFGMPCHLHGTVTRKPLQNVDLQFLWCLGIHLKFDFPRVWFRDYLFPRPCTSSLWQLTLCMSWLVIHKMQYYWFIGLVYVAVTGRKRTLFQNAIIEKNTIKNIRFLTTIVQQL